MKAKNLNSRPIKEWDDWLDSVGDFWGGCSDLFKDAIGNRYNEEKDRGRKPRRISGRYLDGDSVDGATDSRVAELEFRSSPTVVGTLSR